MAPLRQAYNRRLQCDGSWRERNSLVSRVSSLSNSVSTRAPVHKLAFEDWLAMKSALQKIGVFLSHLGIYTLECYLHLHPAMTDL